MHGDFFLLESGDGQVTAARRLPFGETAGRNEAWLRDTLFKHPDLLPIGEIEPSYGPLIPLCTELRTEAGPLDIAFISPTGRLTLVECKLWRNPEARRKVVAQALDYARAIKNWSYADLQRQVSVATGKQGNVPFELARLAKPDLHEQHFVDATSRALRDGRFMVLIAGDGIREDVAGLSDLINRNAASAFAFAQVEVALYQFPDGSLAIQPRTISRTQLIERHVILASGSPQFTIECEDDDEGSKAIGAELGISTVNEERETQIAWWKPVTEMRFDDPEQDAPRYRWRNHVRTDLSKPGLWLAAYRPKGAGAGVFLSGAQELLSEFTAHLQNDPSLMAELPEGSSFKVGANGHPYLTAIKPAGSFESEDAQRRWICAALNQFANALRLRLKAWDVR